MGALPTYFVSHGGGPWPWMKEQTGRRYDKLEASIQDIGCEIGVTPKAVLVVSGHWEEIDFSISTGAQPGMIYDYSGFPPHTYQIKYAAPGSPELAGCVQQLLQAAGHKAGLDPERGFDHGTFTVMQTLYPEANIPVVQLSLKRGYDPGMHIDAGRALAPLREQGVLILGSGLSYHNLRQFGAGGAIASKVFDQWLQQTLVQSRPDERMNKLIHWADAPMARQAHPREDHLMPLHVVVGAAQDETGVCVYHEDDFFGSLAVSSFRFGISSITQGSRAPDGRSA